MTEVQGLTFTEAPHIHSRGTVAKRFWGQGAALLPVVLAGVYFGGGEFLRVLLVSLVSAIAFEFLGAKLLGRKDRVQNGEAVLIAGLIAVLMPPRSSPEMVLLSTFLAVFVAKELCGGMGEYLFHPVLLAFVFLEGIFPAAAEEPLVFSGGVWSFAAVTSGGLLLVRQRLGYREAPVLFAGLSFLLLTILGRWGSDPWRVAVTVLFPAFFLLADPVPMPMTRRGTRWFAAGAALLGVIGSPAGYTIAGAGFAILLMGLMAPWLDLWFRPGPAEEDEKGSEGGPP
ncbi:MAG: RnfABCDGE type electron transport complex subunit D [Candidatus Omnitrophica bacterium]|nr:RnfABCDGE type electron transport complex subunit D [Candidatus Omnitrophota bacterium]